MPGAGATGDRGETRRFMFFSLVIFLICLVILYSLDKFVLRIKFKKETRYGLLAGLGVFGTLLSLVLGASAASAWGDSSKKDTGNPS